MPVPSEPLPFPTAAPPPPRTSSQLSYDLHVPCKGGVSAAFNSCHWSADRAAAADQRLLIVMADGRPRSALICRQYSGDRGVELAAEGRSVCQTSGNPALVGGRTSLFRHGRGIRSVILKRAPASGRDSSGMDKEMRVTTFLSTNIRRAQPCSASGVLLKWVVHRQCAGTLRI